MGKIDLKAIAGSNIHYRFYSFNEFLLRQERQGIRKLNLFGASPHIWIDAYGASDGTELRRQIEAYGIQVSTFTPEFSSMRYTLGSEGSSAKKTWEYLRRCMDFSNQLGIDRFIISANGFLLDRKEVDRWGQFLDALDKLCRLAKQYNKEIFLINHFADGTNMIRTKKDMAKSLAAFESSGIGTTLLRPAVDTASVYEAGERLEDWFSCFGEQIAYVNLSNTKFDGARHCWGDGYLNLSELLGILEKNRFEGMLGTCYYLRDYLAKPWESDYSTWEMLSWACGQGQDI